MYKEILRSMPIEFCKEQAMKALDITEEPVCQKCNSPVEFARHLKGTEFGNFRQYCSKACRLIGQKIECPDIVKLRYLIEIEQKFYYELEEEFNVSRSVICVWCKEHNIENKVKENQKKISPSKEVLEDLYINQRVPASTIAKKFGVSSPTVKKWLIEHNIPIWNHKITSRIETTILHKVNNMPKELYNGYLNEQNLGNVLIKLFPKNEIISQVTVPNTRYRSDYMVGNTIIEFDGWRHFTQVNTIMRDRKVKEIWESLDYRVINIPYFVQLDSIMIEKYFGIKTDYICKFPHGFIDKDALTPDNFCTIGIKRYFSILETLPKEIREQIINTTKNCIWE